MCRILLCIHAFSMSISLHLISRFCLACKLRGTTFSVQESVYHMNQPGLMSLHGLPDEIHELRKREKEQGHEPDWEMEYFMKASAARGKRHSIMTDYVMRMLGLEVCAQCIAALRDSQTLAAEHAKLSFCP